MDQSYAVVGEPWSDARASVSQPMPITVRKANDGPGADNTERGACRAAQSSCPRKDNAKRNKRNNRRDGGGRLKPDNGTGHIASK
jgi:hypothetical protein